MLRAYATWARSANWSRRSPVNVLLSTTDASVAELAAAGVRRVSVGGSLAWSAWKAFDAAAEMLAKDGRLPAG